MVSTIHLSEAPTGHVAWSPEDTFAPLGWYVELPLWVRDAAAAGNVAHNYPLGMSIRGPLNQESLERSLQEVLRRHSVLRSVFRMVDGELTQMIMPLQPPTMRVWDLTTLPEAEREAKARQLAVEDATRPFALTIGPMLRTVLLRLAAEDHILLLTTHHIVCDNWSTGILLRELFGLYDVFNAGKPSPLPELSYQYSDFVRWVQKGLQHKDLDPRFAFWRKRLAGENNFHHVPTDHIRPVQRTFNGTHEKAIFSEEISNSIKLLGQRERVSPFMIMLAGLQCLLQRYCGQDDIGVGSCVANRLLLQLEGLIGPFANVTVLRTDLSGKPTFREILRRVREVSLTAYSYQDLPFGTLVEHLQRTLDPSRNPLFQVLLVLLDAPNGLQHLPDLTIDPFLLDTGTTRYELNLWVSIREKVEVDLQYNSDLFEASTARQILQDYRTLLETMSRAPDSRVADVDMRKIEPSQVTTRGHRLDLARTHNDVEAKLVKIWQSMLGQRSISVTDDYFELGGTSLLAVRLFIKIEEEFGVKLPLSTLVGAKTIKELATAIRRGEAASVSSCLVEIQPSGSRAPFFCIHGAAGSVLFYRDLARHLGPDQPFYGLQPQGIDGERPFLTRIEDMAALYVEEIQRLQPNGPYFLGGYCSGGTIALEMAQQLHARGQGVAFLALFDTYNWAKMKPASPWDDIYFYLQKLRYRGEHFLLLNSQAKLRCVQRKMSEFRSRILDTVRKDHFQGNCQPSTFSQLSSINDRAALTYTPHVYSGRIFHFFPMKRYARYDRPEMGWDELATDGVERFVLPVYPGRMFSEPFVRHLADKLRTCIEAVAENSVASLLPNPLAHLKAPNNSQAQSQL